MWVHSQWASSGINGVDVGAPPIQIPSPRSRRIAKSRARRRRGAATGATIVATGGKRRAAAGVTGARGCRAESVEHIPVLAAGSVETLE